MALPRRRGGQSKNFQDASDDFWSCLLVSIYVQIRCTATDEVQVHLMMVNEIRQKKTITGGRKIVTQFLKCRMQVFETTSVFLSEEYRCVKHRNTSNAVRSLPKSCSSVNL